VIQLTKQKFENLDIWKLSIEIAEQVCQIADRLENLQMNKYSEYMKDVCMRMSNTIAEISGSRSQGDVTRLLTGTHLSILEAENIIVILYEQQLLDTSTKDSLFEKIQILDEKILEYNQQIETRHMLNFIDK
jgi:uncharacterized protein YjcR